MFGFSVKSTFFCIWDHFLGTMLFNFGYIVPFAGIVLSFTVLGKYSILLSVAVCIISLLFYSLYSLGVNSVLYRWCSFKSASFADFIDSYKSHLNHAFVNFLMIIVFCLCTFVAIPFYFSINTIVGFFLGMVMFWIAFIIVLAMQYYYPLAFHMESDGAFKTLRKSFIVMAGNAGLSLLLLLKCIINGIVSVLTCTITPGVTGINISKMTFTHILMHMYDWLDANPGLSKKDADWDNLLYEDRENVGPRSLKGMIFPWKD